MNRYTSYFMLHLTGLLFIVSAVSGCMSMHTRHSIKAIPPTYTHEQFVINNITYSFEAQLTQKPMPQHTLKPDEKPGCRPIHLSVALNSLKEEIPDGLDLQSVTVTSGNNEWSGPFNENTKTKTSNKISNTVESCELLASSPTKAQVTVKIVSPTGNIYYARTTTALNVTH